MDPPTQALNFFSATVLGEITLILSVYQPTNITYYTYGGGESIVNTGDVIADSSLYRRSLMPLMVEQPPHNIMLFIRHYCIVHINQKWWWK